METKTQMKTLLTFGITWMATICLANTDSTDLKQQLNAAYEGAIQQINQQTNLSDKNQLLTIINKRHQNLLNQVNAVNGKTADAALKQQINALSGEVQWFGIESGQQDVDVAKASVKAFKTPPAGADLLPAVGVQSDDERIMAQAAALNNNPAAIFHWVNQNIDYTPSYGQIQGAVGTLLSGQGNDSDTSSLLVAMLRASDVPARFVTADVNMSAEVLQKHLGDLSDIEQALSLLTQANIPHETVVQGGQVVAVSIRRTWVEAWVNMVPAGGLQMGADADNWASLDPAYKLYQYTPGMDWLSDLSFQSPQFGQGVNSAVGLEDDAINQMDLSALDAINSELADAVTETPMPNMGQAFGVTQMNLPDARLLPASLPYAMVELISRAAELTSQHQFSLQVTLDSQGTDTLFDHVDVTSEVADSYWYLKTVAATAADANTLAATLAGANQLDQLPGMLESHQIEVKLQLWSGTDMLAESQAMTLGTPVFGQMRHTDSTGFFKQQKYLIIAGESRVFGWNLQGSCCQKLATSEQFTAAALNDLSAVTGDELIRANLNIHLNTHWAAADTYNQWLAAINRVQRYRQVSFGSAYTWIESELQFGIPVRVHLAGTALSVNHQETMVARTDGFLSQYQTQTNRLAAQQGGFLPSYLHGGDMVTVPRVQLSGILTDNPLAQFTELDSLTAIDTGLRSYLDGKLQTNHTVTTNQNTQAAALWQGHAISVDALDAAAGEAWIHGEVNEQVQTHTAAVLNTFGAAMFWQATQESVIQALWTETLLMSQSLLGGLHQLCENNLGMSITPALMELVAPTLLVQLVENLVDPFVSTEIWPSLSIIPTLSLAPILDPEPPVVNLAATPTNLTIGNSSTIAASATDNQAVESLVVSINESPITLTNGTYDFTPDRGGQFEVKATAADSSGNLTVETVTITVNDPNDVTPPEVDILSPEDGGIITGLADVQVRVQDNNLAWWRLTYRHGEDGPNTTNRVVIAEGTDPVDDAVVTRWDTSMLHNGIYVLMIEAQDVNGQYSNIVNSVFLEGDLKLGHFSIAFEDLNIPVAGIPITITRGYDTRDRNRDRAFGKGWSIGYQSVRVEESRIPGLAWFMETGFYSYGPVRLPRYCIKPAGAPLVSVRLPDGSMEKFKVKAKTVNQSSDTLSNCQNIVPPQYFSIEFEPQGDTNSSLASTFDSPSLSIINGNIEILADFQPIDPNRYTLTMLDGTEYSLDQGFNVRKIKATTGHELRFTENGIEHSGGMSVSFIRDGEGRISRIQKPDGSGVEYDYDANGDLVSFTDLNGNTTTYTYIQDHYLEDIVDPRGVRVARNEYDADGRLIAHIDAEGNRIEYDNDLIAMTLSITDRRGNTTINAFDNAGNIIAQTNALGETTQYEYNHLRLETARINHLGHRTEWTYDAQGNQLTEKDPLGHVTTMTYNRKAELLTQTNALDEVVITNEFNPDYNPLTPSLPQHGYAQLKQTTDALGNVTEFHWRSGINSDTGESISVNTGYTDANGNRYDISPISGGTNDGLSSSSTDLNGLKTETTYDDEARPLTEKQIITDDLGDVVAEYTTSYEYNSNGDVTKVTDPLGNVTRTEYDSLNKVVATIDALGRRTEMEYDDRGNQVLTRYPDGSTETMVYDAENNVIASTDRAGRTTQTIYDALNRVSAVIYPDDTPADDTDNPRTSNSYDAAGRLVAVTDADGHTTTYEYDAAGRRTKTIDPLGHETVSVYDAVGRRTQSTDALNRVTTFEYNSLGQSVKTNFATGDHTSTTYDDLGRKMAETDLAGLNTQYEYDAAGNLVAVIDALDQRTEYSYDQRGNKLTQTDANGHTTSWAYDALNRVVSRTLPLGEVESYTYDAVGNRISKTDFNGDTTTYEYNNLNQLVKTTYDDTTTVVNTYTVTGQMATVTEVNGTTSYSYDTQDRLTRIDYPAGNYIEYSYDLNGNRTQLKTANQQVDYTFDQLNRLKTVTDAAGTTTYTYDAVGNRATQVNANGTTATYAYDPLNRLTDLVHTNSLGDEIASYAYELGPNGNRLSLTEGTGRVVEYDYDDLYRLLSETVTDPVNGNHFSQWSYDPVGNRLQQDIDGVLTTYTYNDNDQLLTETENGVVTSYAYDDNGNTLSKSVDAVLDTAYSYSKNNRMLSAQTGVSSISYTYDAGGIRQSQTVDGTTTHYLVDPNRSYHQVLEEQDDLFLPQVQYTYGDDLINQTNAQGIHTFGYDGLGSTRILTDATGLVQNSYGYQAFGELDYQYGSVENNYLFTGEQYDNNVGFYYLRARYYNPEIGRFSQMDVFPGMQFEPLSLHKYLYTHADPVNNIDPSGYITLSGLVTAQNVNAISNAYAVASIAAQFATGNYVGGAKSIAEEIVYGKLGAFKPVAKQSEKLIKLFSNIWGRGVNLRLLSKTPNSQTLRHNMEQLLGKGPGNHQAHHLVGGTSGGADKARKILEKHDININSPSNGVFLPDCSFKGGGGGISTIHCGRHTKAYDQLVNELLTSADAGGKAAVISALSNLRLQLLSGELALNAAIR